jgi:hypothetical protein
LAASVPGPAGVNSEAARRQAWQAEIDRLRATGAAQRTSAALTVTGLVGVEAEPRKGIRFTLWTPAGVASIAILDMVSRRWLATFTSAEETSTQIEVAFTAALESEGLLDVADQRAALRTALASGDGCGSSGGRSTSC